MRIAAGMLTAVTCSISVTAATPDKYAASSMLSQGNWVRIDITSPGLQTLSRQTLKSFGFSNPEKVRVYGYGGNMIPEALRIELPDDLPEVPVARKEDGSITFFADGIISRQAASKGGQMSYSLTINPYSETSCYFLSDRDNESMMPEEEDLSDTNGMSVATTYTHQLVHEVDLLQCGTSGREYLGEDFRSTKSQKFDFDLPDNAGGNARIRVRFGANTSGAPSSIMISANGQKLPATPSDRIPAVTSSSSYYQAISTVKEAAEAGNALTVGIEYTQGGVVSLARPDWIEVEYTRSLRMRDSRLEFHVNPGTPTAYVIEGATENTIVWDITEPGHVKAVKGAYDAGAGTLTIGVRKKGLHEYIAFEPSAKGATVPGRVKIANQDIHGLPTPDMVIITPDAYASVAEKIANLHRNADGMTVHVLQPEKIYNEFSSGNADVSAFRKLLKMWYDRSLADPEGTQTRYCLIMGRPTYDNKLKNPETRHAGYPRTLIWQSSGGLSETSSYCTDDYIGMLEDETTARSMPQRKINVGVGRYPVTSLSEANAIYEKLESYMLSPQYGTWRNNVMVIADDGDNAAHLDQSQKAITGMQSTGAGPHYAYDRVYLDAFERKQTGTGLEFPDAKDRMLKKWEKEGVAFISYIGHANPKEWGHEKLLTWEDINGMSNQHLPVLYAATCSFGLWDGESVSGAEIMLSNPAGGAISVITPSRTVYIAKNEYITNPISQEFFRRDTDGLGQRLGDVVRLGKNNATSRDDNMLRYHLMGNPALRMPTARFSVKVDSIAGLPVAANQADAPVVKARSSVRISGRITDPQGNPVEFNGPVQYTLFDAEKSVTTNAWGESGKERVYQDRSSKLATGSATARDGVWSANILMPAEIANNYSPALITLYAYDTDIKAEANGSTDRLFVYGFDENAAEDLEGPSIEDFVINSPAFTDGGTVHSSPVALATISDESGINISEAGVGHKMSLTLDSKKIFDDLSDYFVPDPDVDGKRSIAYPLKDIEPGEHELKLTVWDNANNSSSATVNFKVGINLRPDLIDLVSRYDSENDVLTLNVTTDRALCKLDCRFECLDLNGLMLWSHERNIYSGKESTVSFTWDLNDSNGNRLPRGIYILRTTVTSDDGLQSTESKKIAIPAK